MTMNRKTLAIAILVAGGMASNAQAALDAPEVVADAELTLNAFAIFGPDQQPLSPADITTGGVDLISSAGFNPGVGAVDSAANVGLFAPVSVEAASGPDAGNFSAGANLSGAANGNYVGAFSSSNELFDGTESTGFASTHAQGSISDFGSFSGISSSDINLQTEFSVTPESSGLYTVGFAAEAFLRAATSVAGQTANANYAWTLSIDGSDGSILRWAPDGTLNATTLEANLLCVGIVCSELADDFDMTNDAAAIGEPDDNPGTGGSTFGGLFGLGAFLNAGVTYEFSINHEASVAVSSDVIPEPGALALVGLGMLGVGAARARRKA